MKKITLADFLLFGALLICSTEAQANAVMIMPMTAPAQAPASPYSSTAPEVSNAPIYSGSEYPSAEGQYLTVPPSYATQAAPQATALPQPVTDVAPTGYREIPAPQPISPQPAESYSSSPAPVSTVAPQATSTAPVAPSVSGTASLPSYTYDPQLDPARQPYKTPKAHDGNPSAISVATQPGFDIGFQGAAYHYQEHDVPSTTFATEQGPQFALTLDWTKVFSNNWWGSVDLRAGYGINDYTGTGTLSGLTDIVGEIRLLAGKDFLFPNSFWYSTDIALSPYAGLGFRYLYNDVNSSSPGGYERYSHYLYLPVGITPRFRLSDKTRLSLNLEYDQLLYGWQVSALGEADPNSGDVTDSQSGGYGLRGNLMFEWKSFAIGPYFNYWNINQSSTDCAGDLCGDEPHNQTTEYGVQLRYHF